MYGLLWYTIFVWDTTIWKSGIWGEQKNQNIEKIVLRNAYYLSKRKLVYIFTVGNLLNIFMEHDLKILMIFGIK